MSTGPTRAYPLAERTVGKLLAAKAAADGDRPYLYFEDRVFSYAEVDRISNRLANGLRGWGIAHGAHVAVLMDNKPEQLWLYFALCKIGAVSVPVNTAAKGELLAYYLTQSRSAAILLDAAHIGRYRAVAADCPEIARALVVGAAEDGEDRGLAASVLHYDALLDHPDTAPEVEVKMSDIAFIFYTSGTTGPSKGNMSPHASAVTGALDYLEMFGYRPDDILYTCLPMFHGNAVYCTCLPALASGAAVALSRRFSASAFWDEVRRFKATQFNLLGAMTNILWGRPPAASDRDHFVRQCMMVPVPDFAPAFEERFGIRIASVYALTDFGGATILPVDHPPEKKRSAGRPLPHVELAILDDDDMELPPGEVGEICLRAKLPWVAAQGYFGMPEATLRANRNFWFHTGDRGRVDADGYLYFVDRKKDAMRRRGENISSYEVENIILRHPDIIDVAAYGVKSEMSEEEVMVSVVKREGSGLTEEGLVEFCQDNMAYFMVPRFVDFVSELPKTMTEKVEKYKLRQAAEARLPSLWDRERLGIVLKR